jgi:hypothetical protein
MRVLISKLSSFSAALTMFLGLLSSNLLAITTDETESLVSNLYITSIKTHAALNSFYNYTANTGDKGLLADVVESIEKTDTLSAEIQQTIPSELKADNDLVTTEYKEFKRLLTDNIEFVKENGYSDLRLVDDLSRKNGELSQKIENLKKKLSQTTGYKPNPSAQKARELAVTISKMVASYTARSTSSVVQTAQGSDTERPLDAIALSVDKTLAELIEDPANTQEIKRMLSSTKTKWQFIRNSFINYNEKNVNYVVNLYSKRIIDSILDVSVLYAKK